MTPEQMRILIAEMCGWRIEPSQANGGWKLYCGTVGTSFWWSVETPPTLFEVSHALPNYPNDLNAMHEAEMVLTEKQTRLYAFKLAQVLDTAPTFDLDDQFLNIHATAPQRAEAFLRTVGKWKD